MTAIDQRNPFRSKSEPLEFCMGDNGNETSKSYGQFCLKFEVQPFIGALTSQNFFLPLFVRTSSSSVYPFIDSL